jgi:uncharacterized integral membrane protein (TIGR00698 family)
VTDTRPEDGRIRGVLLPGVLLSAAVGVAASIVGGLETRLVGHPIVEPLVLAIVLGALLSAVWSRPAATEPGVRFVAKEVLEVAVLLLGISINLPLLFRAGWALALGIVVLVAVGLVASFAIGKALGLSSKLALLVACGNSICGNSAIAAVAPVIGAESSEVASSIAFTAVVGVAVVLALPLLIRPLGLSHYQYGVLAGLTVYAVPQVLAAAFPVSVVSGEIGTLVKLGRVLLLGPVVFILALRYRSPGRSANPARQILGLIPWFITGFIVLAVLRSAGWIPESWIAPTRALSTWLTIGAMAALGLGVNFRSVRAAGKPVIATVVLSLIVLIALALGVIHLLPAA